MALLTSLPDPISILDEGFRVVFLNPAAKAFLGASVSSGPTLCCYILHGLSASCDQISAGCPLLSIARNGTPVVRKQTFRLDDGRYRLFEVRVIPARLRGKDQRWFLEVVHDISDSPAQAAAIVRGKAEWEATVDSLADPVIMTAPDGSIIRCNRATCVATGIGYVGMLGRQIDEFFWTSLGGDLGISRLPAGTTEVSVAESWYRVTRNPIGGDGSRIGFVYIVHDQTSEREAHEKTVRERERFGSILASLADAVFAVDHDDRITLMNGAAEQMTGIQLSQAGGRRLSEVYRTEVVPKRSHRIGTATDAAAESVQVVQLHRSAGPPLHVAQRRSEFKDATGQRGSVLVVRDMSEIRRLQSIAASVDLTQNLGSLVAGVRHELGNPVNALKTALTMLHESFGEASPERSLVLLDRALKDVFRIERLLERLRKLSLFGDVHPAELDIAEMLRRLTTHIPGVQQREGVQIETEIPAAPVVAWADPAALEQAVLGFLNNAIEATLAVADRRIWLSLAPGDHVVRLRVRDSGTGFTKEALENAFVPLFTTKVHGTGLGLPIARQLLSEMGATISVSNATAGGAVVEVVLSRYQPSIS
ncbi:MAG: PAS domain-containing protein [Thermoanaerobaculia bacterium]